MTVDARIGHGAQFQRGDGQVLEQFAHTGEIADVVMPKRSADSIDATHSLSPEGWREFFKGLKQLEEFSLEVHFIWGGAANAPYNADFNASGPRNYRVVGPDGSYVEFAALVVGLDSSLSTADKMVLTVDFRPTGAPSETIAEA